MLLSTSLCHVLMRKLSSRIPFRGMGGRVCRRMGYFAFCMQMTGSAMAASQTKKTLRGIDWLILVLWSSSRRLTCEASVDNPICNYGTPFFKPTLSFALKKPLKQALVRFVAKQENLRGTDRLHALVCIFVPSSDARAS